MSKGHAGSRSSSARQNLLCHSNLAAETAKHHFDFFGEPEGIEEIGRPVIREHGVDGEGVRRGFSLPSGKGEAVRGDGEDIRVGIEPSRRLHRPFGGLVEMTEPGMGQSPGAQHLEEEGIERTQKALPIRGANSHLRIAGLGLHERERIMAQGEVGTEVQRPVRRNDSFFRLAL